MNYFYIRDSQFSKSKHILRNFILELRVGTDILILIEFNWYM